jgi:uncharacterized protein (TIGR03118 family)
MSRGFFSDFGRRGLLALGLGAVFGCEGDTQYLNVVFSRSDLAADTEGVAPRSDANLVNPVGLQLSPGGNFWVANNATGTVTVYQPDGTPLPTDEPLQVTLPVPPAATAPAAVTGVAYNSGFGLVIDSGEQRATARYLFVTEEGTLLGFNPDLGGATAVIAVDSSASGAVYRGLSVVPFRLGSYVYVTNFSAGTVDVFDPSFVPATELADAPFQDPELPPGYAPFGIQRVDSRLYISYAERDAEGRRPVPGAGKGYVNAFALDGRLLARVASSGVLDAPWGMARVPWFVPYYGGSLLVGNSGNGRIHAFELHDKSGAAALLGSLNDVAEQPLVIDGVWDLVFGEGRDRYPALYFTAGPNGGQAGSFGRLELGFLEVEPPSD